jgi:bifunctional DNA-binding transcriptional regulator/antitoxin component of YhaV-PrlF toxin-antitoxin module
VVVIDENCDKDISIIVPIDLEGYSNDENILKVFKKHQRLEEVYRNLTRMNNLNIGDIIKHKVNKDKYIFLMPYIREKDSPCDYRLINRAFIALYEELSILFIKEARMSIICDDAVSTNVKLDTLLKNLEKYMKDITIYVTR